MLIVFWRVIPAPGQKSSQRDIKHEDTIAVFKGEVDPTTVEQYGFKVEFKYPLIQETWDSLTFRSVNPRQQEKIEQFTVTRDPHNLRVSRCRVQYSLPVPE